MMVNCKETIRLISEGLDHRLSLRRRFSLRMHVMMCGACSAYKRQLEGLHRLIGLRRQRASAALPPDSAIEAQRLSSERREQIKRLLQSNASGHGH